jgi:hypothetical protein
MSDKETHVITGTCQEISERSGWTTFHIDIGRQYPVKLATKLPPLIEAGRDAGQDVHDWTYIERESDTINEHTGKPYVNRYLEGIDAAGAAAPAVQQAAGAPVAGPRPLPPGDKDRAITRMACLRTAAQALAPTYKPGSEADIPLDVMAAAARFETWVYRGIDPATDDVDGIPF